MQFKIAREALLKPLQLVGAVAERQGTVAVMPILANVLLELRDNRLTLTCSNQELEISARVDVSDVDAGGEVTASAHKLSDICQSLPEGAEIEFRLDNAELLVRSGRSNFRIVTLPAEDFPKSKEEIDTIALTISQGELAEMLASTSFSIAVQDFRPYLNGMLLEVDSGSLRSVATDGHRLAMYTLTAESNAEEKQQLILPRRGAQELARLLRNAEEPVTISAGPGHFRANMHGCTLVSKLVNSRYADYERVVPRNGPRVMVGSRADLRQACQRAAILLSDKYNIASFRLGPGELKVVGRNPEQEYSEDSLAVDYQGEPLEIGFNVSYLIDVFAVIKTDKVRIKLTDANSAVLIVPQENEADDQEQTDQEQEEKRAGKAESCFVVSPSRL